MLEGIFHVRFQSSLATVGEGYTVFDACGIHGANDTHLFRGTQCEQNGTLVLNMEITHLCGEKYPSFGPLDRVHLDLTISEITQEGFRALGCVREQPAYKLNIFGRRLGELVKREDGETCGNS